MLELDLEISKAFATEAYKGATRRDGSSMYEHAIRLSNQFARIGSADVAAVALLHDVLPCTELTAKDMIDACIVKPVLELLIAYQRKVEESVIDYYHRLSGDAILRYIKTADIVEDLLCDPTEEEYIEWQYGMMLLNKMPVRLFRNDKVYDYLEIPEEQRNADG